MTTPQPLSTSADRTPLARVVDVFAVALSFGIIAGVLHTLELLFARTVLHELVWFSRDFVWMSPVAYSLVLLPGALVLAILATIRPDTWVVRLTVFGCAVVALFGVLLPYSQIARIAALILSAGVAFQLARTTTEWSLRFYRRLSTVGIVTVSVLAVIAPRWRESASSRAVSSLPSAPPGSPNVLFMILDTVRAASMSLYATGDSTTPHLTQWSTEGTVFDAAYSVGPWTLPSHASLFTGRFAGEVTADWKTPLDRADSTLAELFRERGYATGGFMANMHYTSWDSGLDRGFITYRDYRRSWWQLVRSSAWTQTAMFDQLRAVRTFRDVANALLHPNLSIDIKHTFDRKIGSEVTTQFLDWQANLGRRPFFAVLNYFDAHQPYFAPKAYQRFPRTGGAFRYKAAIAYLDDNIDSILTNLRTRGILDNTLVIVTSDHGELFNEHGLSGHAHNLYRNVLHVPLLLRYPKVVPAGRRVTSTVSLRDMAATIVDLASLKGAKVPGQTLRDAWNDASPRLSPALVEVSKAPNVDLTYPTAKGPMKGLLDDSTHYIRNGDGKEELYHFLIDSSESVNVAPDAGAAAPWRARVDSILQARSRRRS